MVSRVAAVTLGLLVAVAWVQSAQVHDAPAAPAAPTTATSDAPGLKLSFHALDQPASIVDAKVSRMVALAVPRGASASPFLPPGAFHASFEGYINLKIRGSYRFTAHGAGECEVVVNGQRVLSAAGDDLSKQASELVRLRKGANSIAVRYTAPAHRPAKLRLYWSERDEPAGPIPPIVFTHDASDAGLRQHSKLRLGRELFAQWHCGKCHNVECALPEAQADAPSLSGIGSRLQPSWMAAWINDPQSLRSNASMPRLFRRGGGGSDPRSRDIAAYLATLNEHNGSKIEIKPNDAEHGARLYSGLGCVACHSFDVAAHDDARVSLSFVSQKWRRPALVRYLREPHAHYVWNPMPDFKLDEEEARQLAMYLWSRGRDSPPVPAFDPDGADVQRGRQLVATSGCLNCHSLEGISTALPPRPIAAPAGGCLANDPDRPAGAPIYRLNDEQREALLAVVREPASSLSRDTAADFADRQLRALKCIACHTLDGQIDTWSTLKAETDAIEKSAMGVGEGLMGDQSRPGLTWAGEKLRTEWMARFIAGEISDRPRPWLEARMPSFGPRGQRLAEGLAHQHGVLPETTVPAAEPIDEALAQVGRRLVGKEKGFSCVTCHAIGSTPAISPFEAFGSNFAQTAERMRHDFYTRWVRNPQRYEPGTRMPQYADLDGKTGFRDVFDGDAARQFEAIWEYLRKGPQMQPPE